MEAKLKVVIAEPEHIPYLADNMRKDDIFEIKEMSGRSPVECLNRSLRKSCLAYSIMLDDRTIGMFGVGSSNMLSVTGIPWLLGTDELLEYRFPFARNSKKYVHQMLELFPHLQNWVHRKNLVSKGWLRWMGFSLSKAEPVGINKGLFHKFTMRKDYV